jgi:hypothetical protein
MCIDDVQMSLVQTHQQHKLSASYHKDYLGSREGRPQYAYGLEMPSQQVLREEECKTEKKYFITTEWPVASFLVKMLSCIYKSS